MDRIESVEQIADLHTANELKHAANDYNWNDGFVIPMAIADHPKCDLAVALELFWLSEGILWYTGEIPPSDYEQEWAAFCKLITERILSDYYVRTSTSFVNHLSRIQKYKYKKLGVPEVLINDYNYKDVDNKSD